MGRLPFDPSKTAAAARAVQETTSPLTITQLTARIAAALAAGFPVPLRFTGEVSGFRDRTHWYFDLKDADAVVNCVCFASSAKKVGFTPANGQQVIARGRIDFYAPGGKVSVVVDSIEPIGAGALDVAYKALCEELRSLGWFAQEHKRTLPHFPRRIAVITSRTGAALQDVIVTMKKRCPAVGVVIVDARVQGAAAAPDIVAAIRYVELHSARLQVDAVLLTRGGGSMEDLWCFNDRGVAQAIYECKLPIVAAIGHETDTTIAELVADERCATPTQAAMRLTPDRVALLRQVQSVYSRLQLLTDRLLTFARTRLTYIESRPLFAHPGGALDVHRNRIAELQRCMAVAMRESMLDRLVTIERLSSRLERNRPNEILAKQHAQRIAKLAILRTSLAAAMTHRLQLISSHVTSLERQLQAVGPDHVLARGYSITTTQDGDLVKSTQDVLPGTILNTRILNGSLRSVVTNFTNATGIDKSVASKPQRKQHKDPGSQGSLF